MGENSCKLDKNNNNNCIAVEEKKISYQFYHYIRFCLEKKEKNQFNMCLPILYSQLAVFFFLHLYVTF